MPTSQLRVCLHVQQVIAMREERRKKVSKYLMGIAKEQTRPESASVLKFLEKFNMYHDESAVGVRPHATQKLQQKVESMHSCPAAPRLLTCCPLTRRNAPAVMMGTLMKAVVLPCVVDWTAWCRVHRILYTRMGLSVTSTRFSRHNNTAVYVYRYVRIAL